MPWQRRRFTGGTLAQALNIADLRELARRRVPHFAFAVRQVITDEVAPFALAIKNIHAWEACNAKFFGH